MSQSSYIAGFIFVGFLVFITIRGELAQYKLAVLGYSSAATNAGQGGTGSTAQPPTSTGSQPIPNTGQQQGGGIGS